jgi:pyridinium-3,5-biscarboxylic acid mononucleotide synthase
MDEATLRHLLDAVQAGAVDVDAAVDQLRHLPYADLGFARVDHHRALRQGLAEAVYAPGKTPEQCAEIVAELLARPGEAPILLTRADDERATAALTRNPGGQRHGTTVVWRPLSLDPGDVDAAKVVVACAGTADLPVADECAVILEAHGIRPVRLTDVGVAGVHRLLDSRDVLMDATAVVVVAGMEGALASLVGGVTGAPVVAVPTSACYGASFGGITAMLAMLASCAAGITVVGIDNGFGAACAVLRMVRASKG